MLIVREVFKAKPGQASKLASLFKKVMANRKNVRVLTDSVGNFNTVVMESEVKSLAEFEREMEEYKSGKMMEGLDPDTAAQMSKYSEMYLNGWREVFQVLD